MLMRLKKLFILPSTTPLHAASKFSLCLRQKRIKAGFYLNRYGYYKNTYQQPCLENTCPAFFCENGNRKFTIAPRS